MTIEKLREYFTVELNLTTAAVNNRVVCANKSETVWYAIQRCLGASQFADTCGLKYQEIEREFEIVKAKLMELED